MANASHHETDETPARRGRFQFRLRTLLVVMTLLSIPLAWVNWNLGRVRVMERTVAAFEAEGFYVDYDYEWDAEDQMISEPVPPGPAWLRAMVGDNFFARVRRVDWPRYGGPFPHDFDWTRLEEFPDLQDLTIVLYDDTESTLRVVGQLKGLRFLYLAGNGEADSEKAADAGSAYLPRRSGTP